MKDLASLFNAVESHEFSAMANLASNFKTFLRIINDQQPVTDLSAEMRDDQVRPAVCERVFLLAGDEGDRGYEHPWDAALATYLWLLAGRDKDLAMVAAARIADLPTCWWARKMAERVLSVQQFHSSSGNSRIVTGSADYGTHSSAKAATLASLGARPTAGGIKIILASSSVEPHPLKDTPAAQRSNPFKNREAGNNKVVRVPEVA